MKSTEKEGSVAVLLLAAGGSTRMGTPKLAEVLGNKTLFELAIQQLKNLPVLSKVIVLGANRELYSPMIADEDGAFDIVVNENWKKGLSSSIKAGIHHLEEKELQTDLLLVILADMVLVTSEYLSLLIKTARESRKGIVASDYGGSLGPPAIFSRKYLDKLLQIQGDKGAREIFSQYKQDLITLYFPEGLVDIDRPEDLERLKKDDRTL